MKQIKLWNILNKLEEWNVKKLISDLQNMKRNIVNLTYERRVLDNNGKIIYVRLINLEYYHNIGYIDFTYFLDKFKDFNGDVNALLNFYKLRIGATVADFEKTNYAQVLEHYPAYDFNYLFKNGRIKKRVKLIGKSPVYTSILVPNFTNTLLENMVMRKNGAFFTASKLKGRLTQMINDFKTYLARK